jgi:tetratricopeptide (TPR) repeat protein
MATTWYSLIGLLAVCWSLATCLLPWFHSWEGSQRQSKDVLTAALGDSRKLFARHFYVKADAYFHSGYYPSIFDMAKGSDKLHMAATVDGHGEEESADFLGQPKDWIDNFSRHFYPSEHRHLGEETCSDKAHHHGKNGDDDHEKHGRKGEERELLPWLKLAATLDPERPETYIVASFWLRSQLGKPNEAEQFLREGLISNPGHPEMLFELGRIYQENRHNPERARNLWEISLKNYHERMNTPEKENLLLHAQILGNLARLEDEAKHFNKGAEYLRELEGFSPHKETVRKWREELEQKAKGLSDPHL